MSDTNKIPDSNINTERTSTYNMRSFIVNFYLLIMFTFFEMFLTAQYAKARTDKFILFIILTTALTVAVSVISIVYSSDKGTYGSIIKEKPFFSMSLTDIGFISFFLCAGITTIVSDYKLESLIGGPNSRDNGLVLILLYLLMYFIVSRYYYYKSYVLVAFLIFGSIISLLAILHFYYIDPLGIMNGYTDSVINDFGTTIGNKNTIASYMCIFLPFTIMMFVVQNSRKIKIVSAVSIAFAYMGLLVAGSNSGYIGLFAMLFFMFLVCIRNAQLFKNLMMALTIMFSSGLMLRLLSFILKKDKGFEQIGKALIYSKYIFFIIAFFATLSIAMYFLCKKNTTITKWPKNTLTAVVLLFGGCVAGVCVYLFIKYTFIDTKSDIGALSKIFRFDDRWGTHRGFMWINGVKDFLNFDFIHILFGSGCDTFYYVFEPHFEELCERFNNSSTNTIHSEYLNYLVTQGVLGFLSYMTVLVSVIVRAFKASRENRLALIFIFPVIAYAAQAVVNIYQPITTPFLIIFIALSECIARKSNSENKL